ncbi:myeloid differentiation primary response 88 [Paramuricea clavata]|uniref:Myeloid differentiation primary response 88 n=1 Tax=Paramuricea clavata TaxID=317549 RepID=A0A6S7KKZ5_PARCT|nr:myeloid differentiation primary response 88 [Paramuricea clavata]
MNLLLWPISLYNTPNINLFLNVKPRVNSLKPTCLFPAIFLSRGTAPNVDEELRCDKKCLKIANIDPDILIRVCNLLNIEQVLGRDWRTLAGRLGYDVTDVKIFKCKENHAESMLNDWDNRDQHNYLEHVVKELREMRRADVADLLQKEIDKKGDSCNCADCGHLM